MTTERDGSTVGSLTRCGAVWGAATAITGVLISWLVPTLGPARVALSGQAGPVTLDEALAWVCAGLALVAATWLWLVTGLVTVAAARGRTDGLRGIPAPIRGLLLGACGVALATGLAVPAHATPGQPHEDRGSRTSAVTLAGLPLPDRAASATPGGALVDAGDARPATRPQVVVSPGDSLWAIAARDLGPGASDAAVTRRWQQIYELNRAEVGPDPDLIRPALRLRLPLG